MGSDSSKRLAGLLMLIIISVVVLSMLQTETKIIASQIVKTTTEYDLGEKITTYEYPQILSDEQVVALKKYAIAEFFQDDLPQEYIVKGQRDLQAEQDATPQQTGNLTELQTQTEQQDQTDIITNVKTSELTASRTSTSLIESSIDGNVYNRGSIVKIVGKIEMARPAPYFFNVNITCCEMNSFRALSAYETDAFGNFVIKFATTPKFPLGDWTVTISTIGDDNKIIKHRYDFKIIDTSINFEK